MPPGLYSVIFVLNNRERLFMSLFPDSNTLALNAILLLKV